MGAVRASTPRVPGCRERVAFCRDWNPGSGEWLARTRACGGEGLLWRQQRQTGPAGWAFRYAVKAGWGMCAVCPLFGPACNSRVEKETVGRGESHESNAD